MNQAFGSRPIQTLFLTLLASPVRSFGSRQPVLECTGRVVSLGSLSSSSGANTLMGGVLVLTEIKSALERKNEKRKKENNRVAAISEACLALNLKVPDHVIASGIDLYLRQSPMCLPRIRRRSNSK